MTIKAGLAGAAAGGILLAILALAGHRRIPEGEVPAGCRDRVEILCADPSWPDP